MDELKRETERVAARGMKKSNKKWDKERFYFTQSSHTEFGIKLSG